MLLESIQGIHSSGRYISTANGSCDAGGLRHCRSFSFLKELETLCLTRSQIRQSVSPVPRKKCRVFFANGTCSSESHCFVGELRYFSTHSRYSCVANLALVEERGDDVKLVYIHDWAYET